MIEIFSKTKRFILKGLLFWIPVTIVASFFIIPKLSWVTGDYSTKLTVFVSVVVIYFIRPINLIKKQGLRNQPSWVFYLYWGAIDLCILWSGIDFMNGSLTYWWVGLIISLLILLTKFVIEKYVKEIDLSFNTFASGSVSAVDDKLGFKVPAKNASQGLLKLKDYVSVVGLYGNLGFGKSSYARMIIENLDSEKTLYTYISLTETNEVKDFSKLFSERWLETLANRYPKVDITSCLPFMYSILREAGQGFLSDFFNIIALFNRGLIKTKAVVFDTYFKNPKPLFVSDNVGALFGNIPQISENMWIIMIDEIERAQIDEIYRVLEIIERFKGEGRLGLPIKLVFIFCISEPDLRQYLDMHEKEDSRASLLKTFFYFDPKSIAYKVFLPPVDSLVKTNFVINLLDKLITDEEIQRIDEQVNPNTFSDPTISFIGKHIEALNFILGLLVQESPRVIGRIVNATYFFFAAFRDGTNNLQKKDSIRFSDILALEYIKVKYPYLIDFFSKTIHLFVSESQGDSYEAYFLSRELKEKKRNIIDWIEEISGVKLNDSDKEVVPKLIGLVMYYYFDFIKRENDNKTKINYFGTTSYPEIMHDYLSLVSDSVDTSYRKYSQIYTKHKSNNSSNFLSKLNPRDLAGYARFLFDAPRATESMYLEVIKEMTERLTKGDIPIEPLNTSDTILDEIIYQFTFQIVNLTEKDKSKEVPSNTLSTVFDCLKSVLLSPLVNIGAKYIVLNSLVNNERGGGSEIHLRLETTFQKIFQYYATDFKSLIKAVFEDADKRYLSGNQVIYEKEENFFYVFYQGWSGSIMDSNEIEKIRKSALNNLVKYPFALELYWKSLPIEEDWVDLDDVFRSDPFFASNTNNGELYMPLETLIEITKESKTENPELLAKMNFWSKFVNDAKVKQIRELKDDSGTLKAILLKRGLL